MATSYTISCSCGAEQQVQATQAGMSLPCVCGKSVEVPSLGKLKASAGESAVSADFEIEYLLAKKALPLESDCCLCQRATDHHRLVRIECETVTTKENKNAAAGGCLFSLPFALISHFALKRMVDDTDRTLGRHVAFSLPIRICEQCSKDFNSISQAKEALLASPLYSKLLNKYPDSKITMLP